jgi:two-component system chemotaxis sensor kinase CheA
MKFSAENIYQSFANLCYRIVVGKRFLVYRETQQSSQYLFLNYLFLLGLGTFLISGIIIFHTNHQLSLLTLILAFVSFVSLLLLRLKLRLIISGFVFITAFGAFCALLVHLGAANGLGAVWCLIFPIVSILLLGVKYGIYLDIIMGTILSTIIFTPEFSHHQYNESGAGVFFSVYILLTLITITSEFIRGEKEEEVHQLTLDLQQERDELTTMRDNINIGICMIDQSFIIQPYYSQSLEDILSHSNLAGISILDIFIDSITIQERTILKDYFSLVFSMTHNTKLLEEINPLHELEYTSTETKAKRILSCTFNCIQRQNENLLLCAIYDITEQTKTARQLQEESDKRQTEMKVLFEIIQIEPPVFDDFIEDTDYQCNRLNAVLKRNDLPMKDIMLSFYQSIHAIKSNAAILGLEGFAEKCHLLEDEIKENFNQSEIKFDILLHFTMELEKLLVERDKLERTVDKITSFRKKSSSESIFIVSVRKAIERIAEETGKQAILVAENIDEDVITSNLRHILKEIVLQLARNAVFHGIEDPETRISHKKESIGTITLSIKKIRDLIEIVFADDGKGINLHAIKKKALKEKFISLDADDNQILSAIFLPTLSTLDDENMNAGRGIGLSLVADRLKEINGTVSISTEEGFGTTFTMHIPFNFVDEKHD